MGDSLIDSLFGLQFAADWWSLGVVLASPALGAHPFQHEFRPASRAEEERAAPASAPAHAGTDMREAEGFGGRDGGERPRDGGQRCGAAVCPDALTDERTLGLPLDFVFERTGAALGGLLRGLLERDAQARLGANSAAAVYAHPFFERTEWALLEQKLLRAPFMPDAQLVYAKDELVGGDGDLVDVAGGDSGRLDDIDAEEDSEGGDAAGDEEEGGQPERPAGEGSRAFEPSSFEQWEYRCSAETYAADELPGLVAKAGLESLRSWARV